MKLTIDLNIAEAQRDNVHGISKKDMIVLHETVSGNYPGLADILSVSTYLDTKNYGIHGITDDDGNIAWALGLGQAIFYHTDSDDHGVNTRAIGIEQISRVMLDYKSMAARLKAWLAMDKEINATAKLMAAIAKAHSIPLITSDGSVPGVTTHWLVTNKFGVVGGHTDCWPVNNGGYYPLSLIIRRAKAYYSLGYQF